MNRELVTSDGTRLLRATAAALVLASGMVISMPASASSRSCTVEALPVPEGTVRSSVIGGEPTGRYAVGQVEDARNEHTDLLWDNGTLQGQGGFRELDPTPDIPYDKQNVVAVNSSGLVVGDNQTTGRAWVYDGKRYRDLPVPAGHDYAITTAINAAGDIVGRSGNSSTRQRSLLLWR